MIVDEISCRWSERHRLFLYVNDKLFQIIFLEFLNFSKKRYSKIPLENRKLQQGAFTENSDLIMVDYDKFYLFTYTNNYELVHKATYNIDSCKISKICVLSDKLLIFNNDKLISQWNVKTGSYEDTCYLLPDYVGSSKVFIDTKFSSKDIIYTKFNKDKSLMVNFLDESQLLIVYSLTHNIIIGSCKYLFIMLILFIN